MTREDETATPSLIGMLREWGRDLLTEQAGPDRGSQPQTEQRRELLEQATQWVSGALEHWRQASGLSRFLRPVGRDQVVGVGERYELALQVGPVRASVARSVRFYAGEDLLGEAPVDPGAVAWLDPVAEQPGLYRVEQQVLGPGGVVLQDRDVRTAHRIQVVDDAPVLAVDANLVLRGTEDDVAPLHAFVRRGCVLFYFDLAEGSRQAAVREALTDRGLPDAAVLSHPLSQAEHRTLGVDFHAVFATTALRRVRAGGAPLVGLVTANPEEWQVVRDEELELLEARDLQRTIEAELERLHARAKSLHESRKRSDPLDFRLDTMTGTKRKSAHACHVELDNRAARESVFGAIESARRSVHLSFYIFEVSRFTEHLCVRLIAAARRGVRVRLLVDALYAREDVLGLRNPIIEGLRAEPGIEVVAFNPIRETSHLEPLNLKQRDHRKLIVVDSERAFVSGRNAGDEYYTGFDEVPITDFTLHERIPWLDAHLELHGPLVAEVEAAFVEAWKQGGGTSPESQPAEPTPAGTAAARLVLHDGTHDTNALGSYEAILDSAEDHVLLVNDYPIVSSVAAAVRRAIGRGVEVVMLTGNAVARRADGSFFQGPLHREMFEYMTKRRLEALMDVGVKVVEYTTPPSPLIVAREGYVRPYVHAKLMTADGRVASVGSANLDATASYWEREANVVVQDPDVVGPLEGQLRALIARGHRIAHDSTDWRAESTMRELVSRLWPDSLYE